MDAQVISIRDWQRKRAALFADEDVLLLIAVSEEFRSEDETVRRDYARLVLADVSPGCVLSEHDLNAVLTVAEEARAQRAARFDGRRFRDVARRIGFDAALLCDPDADYLDRAQRAEELEAL